MRNHTSIKFTKFLFVSYLVFSLPSFGGIGYVLPDVDDSCHVSGEQWPGIGDAMSAYRLRTDLALI